MYVSWSFLFSMNIITYIYIYIYKSVLFGEVAENFVAVVWLVVVGCLWFGGDCDNPWCDW